MFRTVRHWWGSGRGKITARLFLFELLVVIAGVLIAQALANWVQDQSELRRVNEEQARLDEEVARVRGNALELRPYLICLDRRLDWIMRKAHDGYHFDQAQLKRPDIPRYPPTPVAADMIPLFREHVGTKRFDAYDKVMLNANVLDEFFLVVRDTWPELEMLDTSWGPPNGGDPVGVRHAALKIRLAIVKMQARVNDIDLWSRRLGIAPKYGVVSGSGPGFVGCDSLFANEASPAV